MRKGASAEGRADPLIRCRGSSRSTLPCFLLFRENAFPGAGSYSQRRDTALLFPMSITVAFALDPFIPPDQHAIIVVGCALTHVRAASVTLVASAALPR